MRMTEDQSRKTNVVVGIRIGDEIHPYSNELTEKWKALTTDGTNEELLCIKRGFSFDLCHFFRFIAIFENVW